MTAPECKRGVMSASTVAAEEYRSESICTKLIGSASRARKSGKLSLNQPTTNSATSGSTKKSGGFPPKSKAPLAVQRFAHASPKDPFRQSSGRPRNESKPKTLPVLPKAFDRLPIMLSDRPVHTPNSSHKLSGSSPGVKCIRAKSSARSFRGLARNASARHAIKFSLERPSVGSNILQCSSPWSLKSSCRSCRALSAPLSLLAPGTEVRPGKKSTASKMPANRDTPTMHDSAHNGLLVIGGIT
mmetsp:Transcript_67842/g.126742  ORF Transcript_67842/g.126742 Transcript_67842/m.126742 type:complete len:243 (-) Transcript_67842:148-876(-)